MNINIKRQKLYDIVTQVYLNGEEELSQAKKLKIDHIHRVESLALFLANEIDEEVDIEVLSMGCIMHDIAKFIDSPKHNALGSILTKFLLADMYDEETIEKIANLVLTHNSKSTNNENLTIEQKLLIDADIIDKMNLIRFNNAINTLESEKLILEEFDKIIEKANTRKDSLCTEMGKKYFQAFYNYANYYIDTYKNLY